MNTTRRPRHPLKAAVAIAATLAAMHGSLAQAATREPAPARVDVLGQMPLHEACPSLDDAELADELAAAWQDVDKPSAVIVTFKVQGHHVFDVAPQTDSLRAYHQIRRAVHGLSCQADDAEARNVRFVVRFVDRDGGTARMALVDAAAER